MKNKHTSVAVYESPTQANDAVARPQMSKFPLHLISLVGRDFWKSVTSSYMVGNLFDYRGKLAPFWKRLWKLLQGKGIFCFFEDGPVLVAGLLAQRIAAAQAGHNNDQYNGLQTGLWISGIPKKDISLYETAIKNDQILLFVLGTTEEINTANTILGELNAINNTLRFAAVA